MGDVVGRAESLEGDVVDERRLTCFAVGLPLFFSRGVGADEAGGDVVDGDLPRAKLVGKLPRQANLGCFGRGISLDAGEADAQPRAAGDVDDAAKVGLFHARSDGLGEVESGRSVDGKNVVPIFGRDLFEGTADLP